MSYPIACRTLSRAVRALDRQYGDELEDAYPFGWKNVREALAAIPPEKPYDDMTLEERRARQSFRYDFAHGPCADCQFDGTNVIHDPPAYRADDPYHLWNPDVPYHPFREAVYSATSPATRHRQQPAPGSAVRTD